MADEESIISASLSFRFTSPNGGKLSPGKFESAYVDPLNSCIMLSPLLGDAPDEISLVGKGVVSLRSTQDVDKKEYISVTDSSEATISIPILSAPTLTALEFLKVTRVTDASGVETIQSAVKETPNLSYNPEFRKINLEPTVSASEGTRVTFYGIVVAEYTATERLYAVNYSGESCADFNEVTNTSDTMLVAIYNEAILNTSFSVDSKCCEDNYISSSGSGTDGTSTQASAVGSLGSTDYDNCSKIVHVYGTRPTEITSTITEIEPFGSKTEWHSEIVMFNGANSVKLKYLPKNTPTLKKVSPFLISYYEAVVDANGNTTQGDLISPQSVSPYFVYDEETSEVYIESSSFSRLDEKYYGAVLAEYTTVRYDYLITFNEDDCDAKVADPDADSPGDTTLVIATFGDSGIQTSSIKRDDACCGVVDDGGKTSSFSVKVDPLVTVQDFEPYITVTNGEAFATEYFILHAYGNLDFKIISYEITDSATTNSAESDTHNIEFEKVFNKIIEVEESFVLKQTSTVKLKSIPHLPSGSRNDLKFNITTNLYDVRGELLSLVKKEDLDPILKSTEVVWSNVYFASGVVGDVVFERSYNLATDSYKITGTKTLDWDEIGIVDYNSALVSATGVISVKYNVSVAVYQVKHKVSAEVLKDISKKIKFMFFANKPVSDYTGNFELRIEGEADSITKTKNKMSKADVLSIAKMFGQVV